ncbi:uncharacterized protein SAPINGB_P001512 [Magnusiomyces paraingens]|uniref:NAD+ kinase n=1 Tax=Magnusiomyces paraingens TaxID=2606893 RepID=A0A5E8B640_9ASCO|nr:uncharacterized protein SAPINGB_P001512 [Saprochaete ingens]VVT47037.1 unnamed protein product [Saprochaete ingens]
MSVNKPIVDSSINQTLSNGTSNGTTNQSNSSTASTASSSVLSSAASSSSSTPTTSYSSSYSALPSSFALSETGSSPDTNQMNGSTSKFYLANNLNIVNSSDSNPVSPVSGEHGLGLPGTIQTKKTIHPLHHKRAKELAKRDPSCYVHQKFDQIVEVDKDINALSIASQEGARISHQRLVKTASDVRELAKRLGRATINVNTKSVMIVTKARDNSLVYLTRDLAYWLINDARKVVYVDIKLQKSKRFGSESLLKRFPKDIPASNLRYWTRDQAIVSPQLFDLVITLGGDGTVLYVSKLFQRIVPPIISFSLGSLGFLTNFRIEEAKRVVSKIFEDGINVNLRMRFSCSVHSYDGTVLASHEVLNEIVIDRGPSPWVSMLELYGNDALLTVVQADGLILSTPTGSTAYSLSAGGSLVHPEVSAVSVTPICPHTLSFRPMLLPDSMVLRVTVPKHSRSTAWASFDGHDRTELKPGYYVTVKASQFPFPTIVSSPTEYIDSVSRTLKWNVRQQQKPFEHLLSKESRRKYQNIDLRDNLSIEERIAEEEREDAIEVEEHELKYERRYLSWKGKKNGRTNSDRSPSVRFSLRKIKSIDEPGRGYSYRDEYKLSGEMFNELENEGTSSDEEKSQAVADNSLGDDDNDINCDNDSNSSHEPDYDIDYDE